jgi:glycosyltransferase involved in cell wall biosynthesis
MAEVLPVDRKVVIIPNGVTALPTSNRNRADALRERLQLQSGVPLVVAAGRLSKSKGFDILIGALGHINRPKVACVIAGADAGELPALRHLVSLLPANVVVSILGWTDREGLSDLFSLASVVAIPSRDEPFGLVGLEALGARRRVVASAVGGLAEFLRPPVAELIEGTDPKLWAAGITRALERGPFTSEDDSAADHILGEHSWSHLAQRYEVLLGQAISAQFDPQHLPDY